LKKTILKQLRKIINAAPHLPFQSAFGLALLISVPILSFKFFEKIIPDWSETTAFPIEYSNIQDRIRQKESEFFFTIKYSYKDAESTLYLTNEYSYRGEKIAEESLESLQDENISIWYNVRSPKAFVLSEFETYWLPYLMSIIVALLFLKYIRWLLIKFYELEIEVK